MARSHGKLFSNVWRDEDWRNLTTDAQWLYMLLLSQPKLTLCGSLDIAVDRWARMNADATPESVTKALDELVNNYFVLVDHGTGELAIRTFAKHDLDTGRMNSNLAKGMWRAWEGLESAYLREMFVALVPEDLWRERLEEHAPNDAFDTRHEVLERAAQATSDRDRWSE